MNGKGDRLWAGRPERWAYMLSGASMSLFGLAWLTIPLLFHVTVEYGDAEGQLKLFLYLFLVIPYFAVGVLFALSPLWKLLELRNVSYELWPTELVVSGGVVQRNTLRLSISDIGAVQVVLMPFGIGGNVGTLIIPAFGTLARGLTRVKLVGIRDPDQLARRIEELRQ